MALPHQSEQHTHDSTRDFLGTGDYLSLKLDLNSYPSLHDQSQHRPFIPQFFECPAYVPDFAPAPVVQDDDPDCSAGFNCRKRSEFYVFFPTNPKVPSIDVFEAQPESTNFSLSLRSGCTPSSDDDAALVSRLGDDVTRELKRHDAEISRFVKIQTKRFHRSIRKEIKKTQQKSISLVEQKALQRIREKDEEIKTINRKNKELETHNEQLKVEAEAWKQHARYFQEVFSALNHDLEQVENRDVGDAASCSNGGNNNNNTTETKLMCMICGVREVCRLLLPCKHMCLCKECESELSSCPLCQCFKIKGIDVYY